MDDDQDRSLRRRIQNTRVASPQMSIAQVLVSGMTVKTGFGEIFVEIKNKIQSGYNLREVVDQLDILRFGPQTEKREPSHLYESKIKNMGNAGRNGGKWRCTSR